MRGNRLRDWAITSWTRISTISAATGPSLIGAAFGVGPGEPAPPPGGAVDIVILDMSLGSAASCLVRADGVECGGRAPDSIEQPPREESNRWRAWPPDRLVSFSPAGASPVLASEAPPEAGRGPSLLPLRRVAASESWSDASRHWLPLSVIVPAYNDRDGSGSARA